MEYEVSVDIHAPAERVWEVLADVERWPEVSASISRVELLSGRPLSLGSRARVKQPKLVPLVWTVTALEPGRAFTWEASSGGVTSVGEHRVTESDRGSVRATLTIRQTGPLAGLIAALYGSMTRRYVSMEAQGLKRRAESAAAVACVSGAV